MDAIKAQMLLLKCSGDEIWDEATCQKEGIPEAWIREMKDAFESGFDNDTNTLYVNNQVVNHFEGVSDLHLAYKLAEFLGIDWEKATAGLVSRRAKVDAIKAELDEI